MTTRDKSPPELPEPDGFAGRDYYHRADSWFAEGRQFPPSDRRWTEAQMLTYALQAIANEREACAKVCEARWMGDHCREDFEARRCADAIRARTSAVRSGHE